MENRKTELKIGSQVKHSYFGKGIIISEQYDGDYFYFEVEFENENRELIDRKGFFIPSVLEKVIE